MQRTPITDIIDYLEARLRAKQREYDCLHGEIVGLSDALTQVRSTAGLDPKIKDDATLLKELSTPPAERVDEDEHVARAPVGPYRRD